MALCLSTMNNWTKSPDPSEDKSYIFIQGGPPEVNGTHQLITVIACASFHNSWQKVCLSIVLYSNIYIPPSGQLIWCHYSCSNVTSFLDIWVWAVLREFVNTKCLYWLFPQPQLLWITKHHLLTIIIRLGICHTKSFNSSHWRPGCHFTHSAGKNSFGWNGTACCW